MADSDGEYIASSDDEANAHLVSRRKGKKGAPKKPRKPTDRRERWEAVQRTWDEVIHGDDDDMSSTVAGLLEAGKRRRVLKDTTPFQRGIIRHLVLVLDLSQSMEEKDLRPTRYLLTIRYACDFISAYFEQNPISQLAVVGMRDGLALRISDMSGNPVYHTTALQKLRLDQPKGLPSLQNALDMARAALFHAPAHGTREVVVVFGALITADPGDIHATIRALVAAQIRVSVVGLAAQVAVCRELVRATNRGDEAAYGVAMDEQHFRELLLDLTTPPVTRSSAAKTANGLLMMGFPSRVLERVASLCACHPRPNLTKDGYLCSRCSTKVCQLPTECPACGLTLILSTHLARSYHHLFPLPNWGEVSWAEATAPGAASNCKGCLAPFPELPGAGREEALKAPARTEGGRSVSHRYRCPTCQECFCIDCDVFCHETLYNCPSCQSLPPETKGAGRKRGKRKASSAAGPAAAEKKVAIGEMARELARGLGGEEMAVDGGAETNGTAAAAAGMPMAVD